MLRANQKTDSNKTSPSRRAPLGEHPTGGPYANIQNADDLAAAVQKLVISAKKKPSTQGQQGQQHPNQGQHRQQYPYHGIHGSSHGVFGQPHPYPGGYFQPQPGQVGYNNLGSPPGHYYGQQYPNQGFFLGHQHLNQAAHPTPAANRQPNQIPTFPSGNTKAVPLPHVESELINWEKETDEMEEFFEKQAEEKLKDLPPHQKPKQLKTSTKLFPYQIEGIRYLVKMEREPVTNPFFGEQLLKTGGSIYFDRYFSQKSIPQPYATAKGAILADGTL